jgi:hypothetical protein
VANFCRAFFLVWIAATKNVSTIQHWHDFAGYSIVAVVFLGSLVLASFLGRMKREVRDQMSEVGLQNLLSLHVSAPRQHHESNFEFPRLSFLICASVWLVAVELASTLWYRAHENNFVANTSWTVHWPENAPDLHVLKLDEEVRRTLRFDEGEAASWDCPPRGEVGPLNRFGVAGPARVTCFGYFFHWKSGRNSALLANLHRPDVCLPAIGWRQVADNGIRQYPTVGSLRLPFRHFEFRHGTNGYPTQQVAHAFYCLWEDRAPGTITASQLPQMTSAPSTWTRRERLRVVLEGRRHLGQRVMEVVLHSRSLIDQNEAEASFAALLPRLIVLKPAESH